MEHTVVSSSNLFAVGWEPGPVPWVGTMEVIFQHGALYRYLGVSNVTAFHVALGYPYGSVGRAFHLLIRSKQPPYPYERLA